MNKIIHHKRTTNIVEILQRIRPQVFLDYICHLCNWGHQRTNRNIFLKPQPQPQP